VRGKNIIWLSLIAMMLSVSMVNVGKAPVGNTKIYIDPGRIPEPGLLGHAGDQYVMSVKIDNVEDLWAVGFKIHFAPYVSVMVMSELYEGNFLSEGGYWPTFFTYSVTSFAGTADVSLLRLPQPGMGRVGASGDGTLMTFKLTILEAGEYPIELTDTILLDSQGMSMSHNVFNSYYYGVTASLVRVQVLPGRKVKVGEIMTLTSKVRNNGDVPMYVKVRFDASRAEDGRVLRLYSGQRYLGGGVGEEPRHVYLYADGYTGSYSGWGWVEEGTSPFLDAVGDGNYVWAPDPSIPWDETVNEMPAGFPIIGRFTFQDYTLGPNDIVDNVILQAYTKYDAYDEGLDLDTYARPSGDVGPTTWVGSLWGSSTWGWQTVRWTATTWSGYFPVAKTQAGLNAAKVRYFMYWTGDDLPHGNAYIDAARLRVEFASVDPVDAPMFVVLPGQEIEISVVTWNAQADHVGTYQATATIEYTSELFKWNSWAAAQKTFKFEIVP
jgi:hypothetical protein